MNSRKISLRQKILITISPLFLSQAAQAHDSSQAMSQLDHISVHVAEITSVGPGILLTAVVLISLFSLIFFSRIWLSTKKIHA